LKQIILHSGLQVPPALVTRIAGWPHEADVTPGWLAALPAAVEQICARWEVELHPTVHESMMTLVVPGDSHLLGPVILKASPLADEFRSEVAALKLAAAPNVARVYDDDLVHGIVLMERILPGTQLRHVSLSDDEATRIGATNVMSMWRPVAEPDGLHPLPRWMRDLFHWVPAPELIPADLVRDAQDVARSLLETSPAASLLHGDFQHQNLLQRGGDDWVIIDPKGLVGDPGFDIAAWMYNPLGITANGGYRDIAARRVAIWSDVTGLDRHRLAGWAFCGTVLSTCWSGAGLGESRPSWLKHNVRAADELRHLLG
jgi:streptomycin 6-kinase